MMKKIGIVTVLYNSGPVLDDFFASVESQTHQDWTVYAIDSGSVDGSSLICEARGERYHVHQNLENVGFARGTNQGIKFALEDGCDAILILNNDVHFGPELLQELAAGLNRYDCDMTTPMIYYNDITNRIWAAGGGFNLWRGNVNTHRGKNKVDNGQFAVAERVSFAPMCCVMIRKDVFSTVGLLDEKFFVYFEDTDWMLRARRAGVSLYYIPAAKLWHKVSSLTGAESPFSVRYLTRNHAYYNRKHLKPFHSTILRAAYLTGFAALALVSWRRRSYWRSKIEAWYEGEQM